jgi:hypothetical protein
MGYHKTVQDALETLLTNALGTTIPVLRGLGLMDKDALTYPAFVAVTRERILFDPHPEINPNTAVQDQPETWYWVLQVKGGGGEPTLGARGAQVDEILETIRTALNAQRLTSDCGPLQLEEEVFDDEHGTGVIYIQRWRHNRM